MFHDFPQTWISGHALAGPDARFGSSDNPMEKRAHECCVLWAQRHNVGSEAIQAEEILKWVPVCFGFGPFVSALPEMKPCIALVDLPRLLDVSSSSPHLTFTSVDT